MRKLILPLIFLASLVIPSCMFPDEISSIYKSNPFLDEVRLDEVAKRNYQGAALSEAPDDGTLRFVVLTDQHYGREKKYPGQIERWDDNFYDFLNRVDGSEYPFIICLGDLSDSGEITDFVVSHIAECIKATSNGHFIYAIGNHERHSFSKDFWDAVSAKDETIDTDAIKNGDFSTMGKYVYKDILSIYKLDSSLRTWGKKQLDWLEEALKQDKSEYRIFITHDNITTGGVFDQSLFVTGYGDIAERNRLYRIMHDYNVGVILTGHHHKGNIEYHMSDYMGELNLAAYHHMKIGMESEGFWYEFTLDPSTGLLTAQAYLARTGQKDPRYVFEFKLPKSN